MPKDHDYSAAMNGNGRVPEDKVIRMLDTIDKNIKKAISSLHSIMEMKPELEKIASIKDITNPEYKYLLKQFNEKINPYVKEYALATENLRALFNEKDYIPNLVKQSSGIGNVLNISKKNVEEINNRLVEIQKKIVAYQKFYAQLNPQPGAKDAQEIPQLSKAVTALVRFIQNSMKAPVFQQVHEVNFLRKPNDASYKILASPAEPSFQQSTGNQRRSVVTHAFPRTIPGILPVLNPKLPRQITYLNKTAWQSLHTTSAFPKLGRI